MWPEFIDIKATLDEYRGDSDFLHVKQDVIAEYGEENLRASWLKTNEELSKVTTEIMALGQSTIPVLDMADVNSGKIKEDTRDNIRLRGCFIVRNVIEKSEVERMHHNLKQYATDNKGKYAAWPKENPSILSLYNTPTQNALRSHAELHGLMRWINELWNSYSPESDSTSPEPLVYADAIRMRPPKQSFFGLGPHIDAGSLCRWADPDYRRVYAHIFSGEPENHDAFDISRRRNANQTAFPGPAHSSVLRAFQGWTALSKTAPRQGTILLYPNVNAAISYILLRPFFEPPDDETQIMDASKWKFDSSGSWFPGTFKPQSQLLSPHSHPHLRLKDCLLYVPQLNPGDTVWWHTDVSEISMLNW